jgi:CheY-like chemotaxis protein
MLAHNKSLIPININLVPMLRFASILEKLANSITKPDNQASGKLASSKASILLADDDSDDRELFTDIVKEIHPGITVNTVADGDELMKSLAAKNEDLPDLLFLDLNMPGKNGKQCLSEIRSDDGLRDLPIIIYSTSSLAQDISDTYSIGADLYLKKSSSFSGALATMRKILNMDFENRQSQPDMGSYTMFPDKV